jgi:hypothetical protein
VLDFVETKREERRREETRESVSHSAFLVYVTLSQSVVSVSASAVFFGEKGRVEW